MTAILTEVAQYRRETANRHFFFFFPFPFLVPEIFQVSTFILHTTNYIRVQ